VLKEYKIKAKQISCYGLYLLNITTTQSGAQGVSGCGIDYNRTYWTM